MSDWKRPEPGRIQIEMDTAEYERLRAALGQGWEYRGLVRLREGIRTAKQLADEMRNGTVQFV